MPEDAMTSTLRHYEDFAVGDVLPLGEKTMTRDEIVAFARLWDPQPMHLDEEAGAASLLGSLAASGWHTGCVTMRLLVDGLLSTAASLGSPGIDRMRWLKPVRAGDRLAARLTVLDARTSQSRPTVGILRGRMDIDRIVGETREPVAIMESTLMMRRRTTP